MENQLKKSFFGYSKKKVLSFIGEMDTNYWEKLKAYQDEAEEKYKALENEKTELEQKVLKLEQKIAELEKEKETLKNKSDDVSAVFVDAKHFADDLKEKTKAEEQEMHQKLQAAYDEQAARLLCFQKEINSIKQSIRESLSAIDKELSKKHTFCKDTKLKFNAELSLNKTFRLAENK
ncbi:MAG: hypothetical protein IJE10_05100 [Clostridia bacterium]|nr:hypothetical protein [Clostridia bacterium]